MAGSGHVLGTVIPVWFTVTLSAKDNKGTRVAGFPSLLCSWGPQLFSPLHVVTLETFLSPSKEQLPLCSISVVC